MPEGLKALQDERQRGERVDCTADEQGEELRAAGDEPEGLADDGKGIEDGLPEGEADLLWRPLIGFRFMCAMGVVVTPPAG